MVVFTKYDVLFNEHYRDCLRDKLLPTEIRVEAADRAKRAFVKFTEDLEFPFVPVQVSTQKDRRKNLTEKDTQKQREDEGLLIMDVTCLFPSFKMGATAGAMLVELTKVTRENLRDVEGSLWALWATAQQVNARQKVELSIRYVFLHDKCALEL